MEHVAAQNEWLKGLVDFVFPPLCLGCGTFTDTSTFICPECLKRIDRFTAPFCLKCMEIVPAGSKCDNCGADSLLLYALGNYQPPLKDIIIQYKFRGITHPARLFAELLAAQFGELITAHSCRALVPVPLYPSREYYRGYNQAEVFARELARLFDFNVRTDILARVKRRKPQAKMDVRHRAGNIKDVFEVIRPPDDDDKNLLLVDDVVTTGSTVFEAKLTLEKAGYHVNAVICIAHAL